MFFDDNSIIERLSKTLVSPPPPLSGNSGYGLEMFEENLLENGEFVIYNDNLVYALWMVKIDW